MEITPVIDLRGGIAVHAVGGDRRTYRPVEVSFLPTGHAVSQGNPVELAALYALRKPASLYIADLDAIAGSGAQVDTWAEISRVAGCPLWLDVGVRSLATVDDFTRFAAGVDDPPCLVLGTETLESPRSLAPIAQRLSADRLILSIDRRGGQSMQHTNRGLAQGDFARECLPNEDLEREIEYLAAAAELGISKVIALDVARVGIGAASEHISDWQPVMQAFPALDWRLGGGISSPADVKLAKLHGFRGVLSATAILRGAL